VAIERSGSSVEQTRATIERYFAADHGDVSMIADDAVFTIMGSGDEYRGPQAILGMLDWFYHVAFEASAEPLTLTIGEGRAVGEWTFAGRHIGDFNGIAATGKDVRVPLCVVYDVAGDQITAGRVYFEVPALLRQLGIG
jgi:predicted ester cyclase